jgi:hypothetical protein
MHHEKKAVFKLPESEWTVPVMCASLLPAGNLSKPFLASPLAWPWHILLCALLTTCFKEYEFLSHLDRAACLLTQYWLIAPEVTSRSQSAIHWLTNSHSTWILQREYPKATETTMAAMGNGTMRSAHFRACSHTSPWGRQRKPIKTQRSWRKQNWGEVWLLQSEKFARPGPFSQRYRERLSTSPWCPRICSTLISQLYTTVPTKAPLLALTHVGFPTLQANTMNSVMTNATGTFWNPFPPFPIC